MFSYALKRVSRSLGLFAALLLGVVLASTFFAGVNIGADTTAKAALNQQLSRVLVDVTAGRYGSTLSSANWTTAEERISSVGGVVDTEVISRIDFYQESFEKNYSYFRVVGIVDTSRVHDGLDVTSGASVLGESEAYLWVGSENVDEIEIDDTLTFNFTLWGYPTRNMSIPLKIAGVASLDESAFNLVSGYYGRDEPIFVVPQMRDSADISYRDLNILIVSWEKTFAKLLDSIYPLQISYSPAETQILVFLDREALIHPWDIAASQDSIDRVIMQIDNQVAEFGINAYSNLQMVLNYFMFLSIAMRASFLVVALPVFFVAWYVGTTVSDVSFNLRRREIGLLSAKGVSQGQLFRLFLSESLLVGVMGGAIGVGLSFLLSPYLVAVVSGEFGATTPVLTLEVVAMAVIFGTGITLLSTFRSSRRAAKLPTMDALREYMYVEETKPYKQKWPWLAFFLGGYKIAMWVIGIPNLSLYFAGRPPPTTNILLTILLGLWIIIDSILSSPIGPLLFFWGFTKVFIRGSLGFQELVTRAAKFLGDLGTLATRNVRRNPARAASIAFLIAFIIGYGFQTVGSLASEEDYTIRQLKTSVGADISISLTSLANATAVMSELAELPGVASTSMTYFFSGDDLSFVAVDPQSWLSTAYYENEWFSGNTVANALQQMAEENHTVILEKNVAKTLELDVGDFINLAFGSTNARLKVVGFFGPEGSGATQPVYGPLQYTPRLWSFVPEGLYDTIGGGLYVSGKMLVRLEEMANGTSLASDIRNLNLDDVGYVYSVDEQLRERETNLLLSGTQNVQRIGVVFAVVAASGATALVALVSLQERKKELAIMNVRGLSFKQLLIMLVSENLSIIIFSMALGVAVGLIIVHGTVVSLNTQYATLVAHHIVFPLDAVLILSVSLILVFASSILPVIAVTKRYISKLERIVRT